MGAVETAKKIRVDIKAAIKAGTLPAGLKVRVTSKGFSGGESIHVSIEELNDPIFDTIGCVSYTAETERVISWLDGIVGQYRTVRRGIDGDTVVTNFYFSGASISSSLDNLARQNRRTPEQHHNRALWIAQDL